MVEALTAGSRQRASLAHTDHRPFPLPHGPWVMGQSWIDLLFAHWAVPASTLRPAVPARIPIDTFGGSAWIGITPFEIVGAHPRAVPPLPWLSRFPELNVRTYATIDGRPGIWFFSLDAARAPAARSRGSPTSCPTATQRMAVTRAGNRHRLPEPRAKRPGGPASHLRADRAARLPRARHARVLPHRALLPLHLWIAATACDAPTSTTRRGQLQPARAELAENTMTEPLGIRLPDQQPLLHYAARQDVLVWPLRFSTPRHV